MLLLLLLLLILLLFPIASCVSPPCLKRAEKEGLRVAHLCPARWGTPHLFALPFSASLMAAQGTSTEKFNCFKTYTFWSVLALAVLPSLLGLWWGLHPAVSTPLRVLIVPAEVALAALIAAVAPLPTKYSSPNTERA